MSGFFAHPTALVESADIGPETKIWAYAHIMAGVHIGRDCNIGDHCFCESGAWIGDQVTVKNGCMVWKGVHIEDGVFVGPGVLFSNDRYPRSPRLAGARWRYQTEAAWLVPTRIAYGATLGVGAVILSGVSIGTFASTAAGAAVTRGCTSVCF